MHGEMYESDAVKRKTKRAKRLSLSGPRANYSVICEIMGGEARRRRGESVR